MPVLEVVVVNGQYHALWTLVDAKAAGPPDRSAVDPGDVTASNVCFPMRLNCLVELLAGDDGEGYSEKQSQ